MAGIVDPESKGNLNSPENLNATGKNSCSCVVLCLGMKSVMIITFINLLILHFSQGTDCEENYWEYM